MIEQAYAAVRDRSSARATGARARDGPWRPLPAPLVLAVGAAALAATGVAVYLSVVSRHAPNPAGHAFLNVVGCLADDLEALLGEQLPGAAAEARMVVHDEHAPCRPQLVQKLAVLWLHGVNPQRPGY